MKQLHIIVPVYNEEQSTLVQLCDRLEVALADQGVETRLFFVDDGSGDRTRSVLNDLAGSRSWISVIRLSRNFGHQAAISAGTSFANGDVVVFMDADLQDSPEDIPRMLDKWKEGYQVVYAVRKDRKEGPAKRLSYFLFYRLMRLLADVPVAVDSGDFCLVDNSVMTLIRRLPEKIRFHRGLRAWAGFRQYALTVERKARFAGEPKMGFFKLLNLAMSGMISFSIKPLRLAILLGLVELLGTSIYAVYILALKITGVQPVRGWTSTTLITLFTSGIIIFLLGVIGEYIGQIFLEVKARPSFVIAEVLGNGSDDHPRDDR